MSTVFFPSSGLLLLVWLCRMLLSTGFLCALWMSCLDASSVPVGIREESRCCYLSDGLRGQNAHAVIGTRVVATGKHDQLSSSFCVEGHVRFLSNPDAMEQDG
jgi:hypothetical protein